MTHRAHPGPAPTHATYILTGELPVVALAVVSTVLALGGGVIVVVLALVAALTRLGLGLHFVALGLLVVTRGICSAACGNQVVVCGIGLGTVVLVAALGGVVLDGTALPHALDESHGEVDGVHANGNGGIGNNEGIACTGEAKASTAVDDAGNHEKAAVEDVDV